MILILQEHLVIHVDTSTLGGGKGKVQLCVDQKEVFPPGSQLAAVLRSDPLHLYMNPAMSALHTILACASGHNLITCVSFSSVQNNSYLTCNFLCPHD